MKIAIYSGAIPSTTFIETLIKSLSEKGHDIYLYGRKQSQVYYQQTNIYTYPTPQKKVEVVEYIHGCLHAY